MALLSILRSASANSASLLKRSIFKKECLQSVVRQMGGGHGPVKMNITPSRYQWHKFKDLLHFYVMVGVIPLGALTLYTSIFIGPAKLAPIPEGYVPQEYEHHSHPVSRFLAKYVMSGHQKDYEKHLQIMFIADEKRTMKKLEQKVEKLIAERLDSQAFYYNPVLTKYHKKMKKEHEDREFVAGFHAAPVK